MMVPGQRDQSIPPFGDGTIEVRNAELADAVAGVAPRWVATPHSTKEVASVLKAANEQGLTVVARGTARRLSWGQPPNRVDIVLDTTSLSGVIEHVAGDLVVAVGAGTRLDALQSVLARAGQRLALDGEHGDSTIGGLIANAVSGPSRLLYGTLRDLLIGVTFVRGDGVIAKAGGKVVKNVAGYDIGKLLHGSWGTLAVITEAILRLHPVPPAQRWVTIQVDDPSRTGELVQRVLHSQLVPTAIELDRTPSGSSLLTVMLEGIEAGVRTRADSVSILLGNGAVSSESQPEMWGKPPAAAGDYLLRLTTEVASLPLLLDAVTEASSATGLPMHIRGSVGVGSMLASLPGDASSDKIGVFLDTLRRKSNRWGGTVVVLDAPLPVVRSIDTWGPVQALDLMRSVKVGFDPARVLSPGRFVGGI